MSDPASISSGMNLPQWMRSRIEKNDVDGIPFSPPSHDEFFYIRYPTRNDNGNQSGITNLTEMLSKDTQLKQQSLDFSKHTEPCKRFLQNKEPITSPIEGVKNPPKSFGIDDGFKGPGAACGSSIVKVAQLMVSGRSLSARGFTVANLEKEDFETDNPIHTKTIEDQQTETVKPIQAKYSEEAELEAYKNNRLLARRGSKSLPASPIGSPKSMRKYQPNPYFTGSFALSGGNNTEGRSWFMSSLLGVQREAVSSTSVSHIEEESAEDVYRQSAANTTTSNTASSKTDSTKDLTQKQLKAKPSELREMNFWTPTSM